MLTQGGPGGPPGPLGLAIASDSYPLPSEFAWVRMEVPCLWHPLAERELSPQVRINVKDDTVRARPGGGYAI
jgi:hypothetical protein